MFQRAGGAETKDPRTAQSQLGLDVFQAPVPPDSPGAVVSKVNLLLFLLLPLIMLPRMKKICTEEKYWGKL